MIFKFRFMALLLSLPGLSYGVDLTFKCESPEYVVLIESVKENNHEFRATVISRTHGVIISRMKAADSIVSMSAIGWADVETGKKFNLIARMSFSRERGTTYLGRLQFTKDGSQQLVEKLTCIDHFPQ
ncbi:MAG TPA: hypothetical protein VNJ01_18075 [Bacteriovoracaceae bacterium]|nr:hypothetical protein [Bacteriovoracaceae bacterium]